MTQDQASPSAIVPDNDFAAAVEEFEHQARNHGYSDTMSSDDLTELNAARSTLLAQHDALLAEVERLRGENEKLKSTVGEILKEADTANTVISLNRDGGGNGRVKVATAMHRIARVARHALDQAPETRGCAQPTTEGRS